MGSINETSEDPARAGVGNTASGPARRRPFRRIEPSDGEVFLSDHLGLDTTLFVSARHS